MINLEDIAEQELEWHAIRAGGPGGQHVNKVSTAVHLRFDVHRSSLPDLLKQRLLRLRDHRLTTSGVLVIKANQFRSQAKNREDALHRLDDLIQQARQGQVSRRATRPTLASIKRRLDAKNRRGDCKRLRSRVDY